MRPWRNRCPAILARVRVLVVEDDEEMAHTVATGLRRAHMAVDVALDGTSALERALCTDYDVVVLDRDLPGTHGDEVCAELIAAGCRSRVLMLTAAATTEDLVDGLGLGADDYLAKPFHFPELVLRVQALSRRRPTARARTLRVGGVELDPVRRTATRDGVALALSVKEFAVLEALLRAWPGYLSAERLLEQVWDEHADPFTNTVTVTVGRLRRKLGGPPVIATTPGVGYRIAD